jgi:hypothetical protein
MTGMGQCRHCGRTLVPNAQFCERCGVAVPAAVPQGGLTPGASGVDTPTMAVPTTDLGPPGPDDPYDPYDWEPRRRVLPWIAGVVAIALIVAAVFVVVGSGDKHRSVSSKAHLSGPIVMPWVVTFKLSQAITALEKDGVDSGEIDVVRVARTDMSPGTVINQIPSAGMTVDQGVTLTAARAPDTVPNFVGKGVNTVLATLSTLDVKFTVEDLLDAAVSDGTVLAQSPAAGSPFSPTVRLTIARKPIPTNLADLTGTGAPPTPSGATTLAGVAYPDSLSWRVPVCPGTQPVTVSYLLAGHYRKLTTTAGVSADPANPADQVHLDIAVDGVVVVSRNLDQQSSVPVDIDLVAHQQLALTFTAVGATGPRCWNAEATLGRARLLSIAQNR